MWFWLSSFSDTTGEMSRKSYNMVHLNMISLHELGVCFISRQAVCEKYMQQLLTSILSSEKP